MPTLNRKTLPAAVLGFVAAGALVVGGLATAMVGAGVLTPGWWIPWLVGVGAAMVLLGAVVAMFAAGKAFETDWDGEVASVPRLPPESFSAALDTKARPCWVCTQCRVAQGGIGIGSCMYCDSGEHFYVIESDEDARMVRAAMA
ncbi:MAG: hypothetical protein H6737_19985 [Alphaproteobacteria bacterium]|nr:hypothetical protein [Alphaproteobacteria bacterium]